jgi:hypothetical protein
MHGLNPPFAFQTDLPYVERIVAIELKEACQINFGQPGDSKQGEYRGQYC